MAAAMTELRALFCEALDCPPGSERQAYLDRACGGDTELRSRLESLLAAHDDAGDFLQQPVAAGTVLWDCGAPAEAPGSTIGPYLLIERLGEGGMGVVFSAEQTEPVARKVALKIIKPGMDTRQVVARFEVERQALALMDHPNIARVVDAGSTESGRPYFVMELVDGIPITTYCDQNHLAIAERLELFVLVCRAVQHAHQKGVIHRDLKPSNVLITLQDGVPVPKIIDFGIAKATGQGSIGEAMLTGVAQVIGTPLYMSPEQADGAGHDVDTRSDVYSLGVLLYELLTGTTPFEPDSLHKAAFDEIRRLLREQDPPAPSTRLGTLSNPDRSSVSANRQTDPRRLDRAVHGELDWIVMKCLEKDRTRRYESVSGLAGDLMRFLTDQPVEAGPPSALYRLSKYAHRHRAAFTTVGLVALALLLGTAVSAWQAVRATAAEGHAAAALGQAEENLDLARQAVDELYDEVAARWRSAEMEWAPMPGRFLEKVLPFYRRFTERPESLATGHAQLRVGEILLQLQRLDEAVEPLRRGEAIFRDLLAARPDDPQLRRDLATCLFYRAKASDLKGDVLQSEIAFHQSLAIRIDLAARNRGIRADQYELATTYHTLGVRAWGAGHPVECDSWLSRALEIQQRLETDCPAEPEYQRAVGQTLRDLGNIRRDFGRITEAEPYQRRALAIHEALVARYPTRQQFLLNLAWDYWELGRTLVAERKFAEVPSISGHAATLFEGLASEFPEVPGYRAHLVAALGDLAIGQVMTGHRSDAETTIRRIEALGIPRGSSAIVLLIAARPFDQVAWYLAQLDTPGGADPARALALTDRVLSSGVAFGEVIGAWHVRGMALYRAGRWDEAIATLKRANELEHDGGFAFNGFAFNGFFIAMCHQRKGERAQARDWYDRSVAWMVDHQTQDPNAFRYRAEAEAVLNLDADAMLNGEEAFAP